VRGFFDTDQRPLRGLLERWQQPLLIVHGAKDFLVPAAAAREHHRIVPHSELELREDGSHFLVWSWTVPLAERLLTFIDQVEAGTAATRADADPVRVAASQRPFDPADAPPFQGLALIGAMIMLAGATFLSEDLTCFSAGLLVSQGRIEFIWATLACFLGIFIGDVGLYLLGRWLGRPALKRAPLKWFVTEEKVEQARHWFESRGALVIFLSRFMPGLRLPTYVAAGVVRTSLPVFAFWFVLAGMIWTPALVGIAGWIGTEAQDSLDLFGEYALWGVLGLLVFLVLIKRMLIPMFSWRGRRILWGKTQRLWRWEFWPAWLFYLPIAGWIGWLGLRYRSLALVTASNPAIPTGGFVGESKADILEGLGAEHPLVARFTRMELSGDAEARWARAQAFTAEHGYPAVLKPNVGQRGSGVQVCRDAAHLERAVRAMTVDCVLQAFAPGVEFGVFYARKPGAAVGRIISITEKVIPEIVGDGERTVERLILSDPRAICAAQVYLDTNKAQLTEVLPAGERLALVDLGTHARGAIFLDGARCNTPELLAAIDELSRGYEGFFFGRYDVRVPDADRLARGEGIQVIELNGVTSESTHIYDPRHSLLGAWATLMRQWSLAYAIAKENRDRGAASASVWGTFQEWRRYRAAQKGHTQRSRG
ncbi:MAG: VTT domain-containing protein, partial [Planctomycetota bacterium]|nr:VTT domain-containing protein [Planctomycetota bacterium]